MSQLRRKKLIEVALPLEAINRESAREKSIRHGHPSTLHLWWARRPLAACRAVLFASIVDDPSSRPEEFPTEEDQERERQRLFRIIEELVKWENSNNEQVLDQARAEIVKATDGNPPPVLDPFCGGGSIPLEAQRLGLEAHASDLNPVAVLITKALIEIPPKFAGQPPVNPEAREKLGHGATWKGAQGLAEDVRYYGEWMRNEAFKRIGHLYPKAKLPDGGEATVIGWLWARTVTCPNPACGAQLPLASSLKLSTKRTNRAWLEPLVSAETRSVRWRVATGEGAIPDPPKAPGKGSGFRCLVCGSVADADYIHAEFDAGRSGANMLAVAAEAPRKRLFVEPRAVDRSAADTAREVLAEIRDGLPSEGARGTFGGNAQGRRYGFYTFSDYFTPRQLVAIATFVDLVRAARDRAMEDGAKSEHADAIATYLGLAVSKSVDYWSALCVWRSDPKNLGIGHVFARQAIQMVWDFAEANPFSNSSGNWLKNLGWSVSVLESLDPQAQGRVQQLDAMNSLGDSTNVVVVTDPPYYDNIGYADLADYFYVWMRRALASIYPQLFSTLLTPKTEELVANYYRFDGDRHRAHAFFEEGLEKAFRKLYVAQNPEFPLALFYAFKQTESAGEDGVIASSGWDTMLSGLLASGFGVYGTWPVRSELRNRTVAAGTNALASSIVLVCRPRDPHAPIGTRRECLGALREELPAALRVLQHGNIAPVDLAQAAIGPGMAVFSRYAKVLEADGTPMSVRGALGLINHALDEILAEQEGDFDHETRFAVTWFEQRGTAEGPYGEADVLARAKDTSVEGMVEAGVLFSRAGKVRLLGRDEMPEDWDPVIDRRPTAWEAAQHLTRRLQTGGEAAASDLLRRLGGGYGERARELAYRLYSICERKGWAQEALPYNALVVAWPEIARRVAGTSEAEAQQTLEV